MEAVEWPFDEGGPSGSGKLASGMKSVAEYVSNKEFDLIINLPTRGSGSYRISSFVTQGYK